MSANVKCVVTALIVFGVAIAIYMAYASFKKKKESYSDGKVRICLFYATWCHHCEKYLASGVFDKTYQKVAQTNSMIEFEKIDYDENKNLAAKYGVNSFPAIIAVDSNGSKITEFKGDRNNSTVLEKFALSAAANA